MKLVPTRRTDYGIRALIYLAQNPGDPVKASVIAEAMDIPQNFLHQVLQVLHRSGLVNSRPSRHGGYLLTRKAESVTLGEIIEALEGPIDTGECALRGGPCHWDEVCALHWVWSSAREALKNSLSSATLADIASDDLALAKGNKPVPQDSHRRSSDVKTKVSASGRGNKQT